MKNDPTAVTTLATLANGTDDGGALPQLELSELDAVTGGGKGEPYRRYVRQYRRVTPRAKKRGKGPSRSSN